MALSLFLLADNWIESFPFLLLYLRVSFFLFYEFEIVYGTFNFSDGSALFIFFYSANWPISDNSWNLSDI